MNGVEIGQVASIIVGAGALVGSLLAYFKFKPGQKERVGLDIAEGNINVAQGTLNIAHGSIQLVTATLEAQFKRMDGEMDEMRREHAAYRELTDSRLSELAVELRAERAEKVEVKRENVQLTERVNRAEARVKTLEAEVASLKAARGSATPPPPPSQGVAP